MALTTDKIALPVSVATAIINKAKDTSTIARLSPSSPQIFADADHLIFSADAEAEVVGEGEVKSSHEYTTKIVEATRFKVQTTTRVSSELKWADEDNQLQIISQIQDDQAGAIGRALDYVVYHGVNPKTGETMSGYTPLVSVAVQVAEVENAYDDIDNLADALNESYDINGFALSKTFAKKLRKCRNPQTLDRMYPDIPLNLNAGSIDGIAAATSGTVNGRVLQTASNVLAIMGDFSLIKWGMVRNLTAEIIEYGDPDQTGVDLKAHNQIAYRTEGVYAYAVLDPEAFAVLTGSEASPTSLKATAATASAKSSK